MGEKLGFFGGTFDPPHVAHLLGATQAWARAGLSRVVFVPAGDPYQKKCVASADDRYEMTRLAVEGNVGFEVSRMEIDREGPTYTIDSVDQLLSESSDSEVWLVAGADTLSGIRSWHEWERLVELVGFVILPRPGASMVEASEALGPEARVEALSNVPELDVSSTEIRQRIKEGLPVSHLLASAVEEYIYAHGLYK